MEPVGGDDQSGYNPPMTLLVTGGAGFVGSHLVRALVERGEDIALLVKPTSQLDRIADILPKLKRCEGDVLDAESLKRVIAEVQPKGIFHLAASNIQSGVTAPDNEVVETNVLGMSNLLKASEGIDYDFFIHTGSFLEYGMKNIPMREDDTCNPPELYSVSKLAATLLAQAHAQTKNKPVVGFRIFTPYGPGMQTGRLMEIIIRKALQNEEIKLTQPTVTRDFLSVSDIADLMMEGMTKARTHAGQIFNAGSGAATTLQEVVDEVFKQTGSTSAVHWNAFPPVLYDTALCQADMHKTFAAFSWRPKISLAEGIAQTIDSIRTSS